MAELELVIKLFKNTTFSHSSPGTLPLQDGTDITSSTSTARNKHCRPPGRLFKKHSTPPGSLFNKHSRPGRLSNKHSRPPGRPFNNNLEAKFVMFESLDELILSVIGKTSVTMTQLSTEDSNLLLTHSAEKDFNNERNFRSKLILFQNVKNGLNDLHMELCTTFDTDNCAFVKVVRNTKGKVIKLEVFSNIKPKTFSIDFIKKHITFPRYKAKMKLYLVNGAFTKNVSFYNDLGMLLREIENNSLTSQKILINNQVQPLAQPHTTH